MADILLAIIPPPTPAGEPTVSDYDSLFRAPLRDDPDPRSVLDHRGTAGELFGRFQTHVDRAHAQGIAGVKSLAPYLLRLIADPRVLHAAWEHLARDGGPAPGPDGLHYPDLCSADVWGLCRALGKALRSGTYRRGPDRIVLVSKGPGRRERPLVLSNLQDRVVERAIASVLGPILDPLFDPHAFGFRPRRGRLDALALAERLVRDEGRRVWLVQDLQDAFLKVPLPRLLPVVRRLLPADDLMERIEQVLAGGPLPGLRQGGPLSPLLLNTYLNHVLDRPWRRDQPGLPLLRVADDLLVPCRTVAQAGKADATLRRLLVPAGMPVKWRTAEAIHDLGAGATVTWMGFAIRETPRGLETAIAESSWGHLGERLARLHAEPEAPLRAGAVIQGWIGQQGPCYRWSDRAVACRRVVNLAAAEAFDEVPGIADLRGQWQRAHARWCRLRTASQESDRGAEELPRDRPGRPEGSIAIDPAVPPWEAAPPKDRIRTVRGRPAGAKR